MRDTTTTTEKGAGLARGPALIVGSILLAFGLIAMISHSAFPSFGSSFPDGNATGSTFLGIEVNGWTNWLAAVGGGLLLFGSAQHALAKVMSLIVGGALGAAAIIALIDGDVLGLAAANAGTVIGFGAAAVVLFLNLFAPRLERERTVGDPAPRERTGRFGRNRDRDGDGVPDREQRVAHRDRDRDGVPDREEPVTRR